MSATSQETKKSGWFVGLIDGAARVLSFSGGETAARTPEPQRSKARPKMGGRGDLKARASLAKKLAAEGKPVAEIARETSLSQDMVTLLLHLPEIESAETADRGTFFRILQTRMAD